MKKRFLRLKTALRAVMLILMMGVVGITEGFAYDFSAVCETGQTLYYNIADNVNHYVIIVFPGTSTSQPWSGFTEPSGDMTIPDVVTNGDIYQVTSIDSYAFRGCTGLTSVEIPNSVTSIGNNAFSGCTGLTTINWNAVNVISYPYYSNNHPFNNCTNLSTVVFGEYVETIPSSAFVCTSLTSLTIGNSVTSIGDGAFDRCLGLTSVEIPNSVTSIGEYAFRECTGLTSLTIGNSVTSMGLCAFALCTGLTSVEIPNSVTSIGNSAFSGCTGLTSVEIPNSVTSIGDDAFSNCRSVTSLTIPNSVTSIGNNAFSNCRSVTSLTIPNSVTSIGNNAFSNCRSVTSLTIPNSVTSIGNFAFYDCRSVTSLTIPNSVTSIGIYAFGYCKGLTSVEIPNSVTSIGDGAFYHCSSVTSLTIPNSVTSIGDAAFGECTGLTSVEIPNSVTSIGDNAFRECTGLTSLTIGNSVTSIGDGAFQNCSNIESMTVLTETPQTIYSFTFYNVPKDIPVYVPDGSISSYQAASYWKDFTNYQEMGMADVPIKGYGSSNYSDHWVFIASPLASSVKPTVVDGLVADPVENYDLYRFNQSGENGEWENYKGHTAGFVLENGKGYLYANKNDVTLTFAGTMNMTASKEVELDYDGTANMSGWNLVGNPFTEAAYIDRPYYKMNDTGTDVLPVATYKETPVAAYSGIMVQAKGSGESVTFTKSGSKSSDNGGLQITLSKAGVRGDEAQDKVIVSFNKYAQLSKFIFNEDNAKLYIPMGGEDYAIAYSDRQSNMPLYFKTKEMGIYTMSFEGAIDNIKIIDNLDGSVIDLNAEKSFTFVGTPSDRNDRFTIVFNTPATEYFAYQSGDGIVVNGEGELQVFDIMGRMVAKYHVNGVETVNIPCQSGVYVLRLLGKETNTQKIVVK